MADFNTPPTAEELAAAKSDPWSTPPTPAEVAGQPQDTRGFLRRGYDAYKEAYAPLVAQQQQNTGPHLLGKDSSDLVAGIGSALSGLPGAHTMAPDTQERLGRFRSEHPILGRVLPIAAGLGAPVPAATGAKAAGVVPPAATAIPKAVGAATEAVPAAAGGLPNPYNMIAPQAPVNAYEAAGRAAKVASLAKAVEANVTAHLGSDALKSPQFSDTIAKMPQEWWNGMAKVAKVNAPSQTTIGEVANFFRDRAAQTAQAVQEAAPVAQAAAPVMSEAPKSGIAAMLENAGNKLSSVPKKDLNWVDLILAGQYGIPKAVALHLARNYGPTAAGYALKKASQLPGSVAAIEASRAAGAALEGR